MSINAAASSTSVNSTASSSQVNSASNSDNAKKSSSDSSFKEEMNKVSSTESKKDTKGTEKSDTKVNAVSEKTDKNDGKTQDTSTDNLQNGITNNISNAEQHSNFNVMPEGADYSNFGSMSMVDVNSMLTNDIAQMANREASVMTVADLSDKSIIDKSAGYNLPASSISMTQSDADFFINLTQNNDVSVQNITAQAQNMLNQGANAKEVKQNVQISQTLLEAINTAKENNQPLRIDFDQNVSVILRVNKEGAISANFIPGSKAVEQYLKNNIDSLKAAFNENELPYSDLSYSNRGRQQQRENRRNKQ